MLIVIMKSASANIDNGIHSIQHRCTVDSINLKQFLALYIDEQCTVHISTVATVYCTGLCIHQYMVLIVAVVIQISTSSQYTHTLGHFLHKI